MIVYQKYLSTLESSYRLRKLQHNIGHIDFSTNDYLGLSKNKEVIEAAIATSQQYGVGATGSRLLSGNFSLIEELENQIAVDKNTEASLVFSSGFQANFSTLSAILDSTVLQAKPIVFFDTLNHSSLYQAIFLTKAELYRYRHNDINHLQNLLNEYKNDTRPKFIVTETVFGMDGDMIDLKEFIVLAEKYNAFLYLDEAHATGVFGKNGYGLSTNFNLQSVPHIVMGTFSKALGCSGGYIACDNIMKQYLINKANGFIYSTAPSPIVIGAALAAWKKIYHMTEQRQYLQNLGVCLRQSLRNFNLGASTTHIIPIILENEEQTIKAKEHLYLQGIIVSAVRPPTVPINSSRLRIALTVNHTVNDLKNFIESLIISK